MVALNAQINNIKLVTQILKNELSRLEVEEINIHEVQEKEESIYREKDKHIIRQESIILDDLIQQNQIKEEKVELNRVMVTEQRQINDNLNSMQLVAVERME